MQNSITTEERNASQRSLIEAVVQVSKKIILPDEMASTFQLRSSIRVVAR